MGSVTYTEFYVPGGLPSEITGIVALNLPSGSRRQMPIISNILKSGYGGLEQLVTFTCTVQLTQSGNSCSSDLFDNNIFPLSHRVDSWLSYL